MSNTDGTCEYVLDPEDPETWGGEEGDECLVYEDVLNEDGVWTCPHDAEEGEDLCIFHLQVEKKDDEEVVEAFVNLVNGVTERESNSSEERRLQFVGARFGEFDLSATSPELIAEDCKIRLSHTIIEGELDWTEVSFEVSGIIMRGIECFVDSIFRGVEFGGGADFSHAEFGEITHFGGAEFGGNTSFGSAKFGRLSYFQKVKFGGLSTFREAVFEGDANFGFTKFREEASFNEAEFGGGADFKRAEFGGEVGFRGTEFSGGAGFERVEFGEEVGFRGAEFGRSAYFKYAEFERDASFRFGKFEGEAIFNSAAFGGEVDFKKATFGRKAAFERIEFGGVADFRNVRYDEVAGFRSAKFGGNSKFWAAEFGGEADFEFAEFNGKAIFTHADFGGEANFESAEFNGNAIFGSATFRGEGRFKQAEFGEIANFGSGYMGWTCFRKKADFHRVDFHGETSFREAGFEGEADFKSAEFGGGSIFHETKFKNDYIFTDVTFEKGPDFHNIEGLAGGKFDSADLTDAIFTGATLHNADFENALLSRATLLGADFRGAKLNGAVLGDVRIDEDTQFLGHPDNTDSSPHTLSAIRSRPTCVYDPDYEKDSEHEDVDKAKSVYRALEELGGKHARPRLQARSFVRRQDLQKKDYWDDATADDASLEERLIAGARWSRSKVARTTLLYGESPWRIIGGSIGFIFLVSLLYPLGEWLRPVGGEAITYSRILGGEWSLLLESLYFSTLTFTTLGMGDYEPMGFGQVLATLNTALGAVLIALLVFVLGRRAAR